MFGFIGKLFGSNKNEQIATYIAEGAKLIDVRTPGEFKSGSVRGAINIPVEGIQHNMQKIAKDQKIVVFCRSGMRSAQAKIVLKGLGYTNVINGGTWNKVAQIKG